MNWERSKKTIVERLGWLVAVSLCAWMTPSGEAGELKRLSPHVINPQSQENGSVLTVKSGTDSCNQNSDCQDNNLCTTDRCTDNLCVNNPISGCVPCEVGLVCQPTDVVFVMDTSGSMADEADALCNTIDTLMVAFSNQGIQIRTTILGITETPSLTFPCITDNVLNLLGGEVPRNADACPFPDSQSAFESWGPATAIVAERFEWLAGARRIIIPVSDEGPCNGSLPDGCNDPGDDRASIENAIEVALTNRVKVSTISGTGSDVCSTTLAQSLASGTYGGQFLTTDAAAQIGDMISQILLSGCQSVTSCDDGNMCTCNDTCTNGVCVGNDVSFCKPCNVTGVCNDGSLCTDDECVGLECVSTPNFDADAFVCDPTTGTLTPLDQIDDGNPCTELVVDECTGIATNVPVSDCIACEDGLFCTVGDICIQGVCQGGPPPFCGQLDDQCNEGVCDELSQSCTQSPINEGNTCDDGEACLVGETCQMGSCVGQAPPACHDTGNPCTVQMCDPNGTQGNCDMLTSLPEGSTCDDGLPCHINDTCMAGICTGGEDVDCSAEGDQCNIASCNPGGLEGNCAIITRVVDDTPCDDGLACNINETCQMGICSGGLSPNCSEFEDQCNTVACDPMGLEGNCDSRTPVLDDTPCDDELACNINETCQMGICTDGQPTDCIPFNTQCSAASCDPLGQEGNCDIQSPMPTTLTCDDGLACTVDDRCVGIECVSGRPPDCSPFNNQCNVAACDPMGLDGNCDTLIPVEDGTPCDDGMVCKINETCQMGDCKNGEDPVCDTPVDQCLMITCDSMGQDGNCDNTEFSPRQTPCDDGDGCTVFDQCDGMGQCLGTDINTLTCTTDANCFGAVCNDLTGFCVCNEVPELCLETVPGVLVEGCYQEGEDIRINVVLKPSIQLISGGQFLIEYDASALEFVNIAPGAMVDPMSPFSMPIGTPFVDENAGRIFYSVGIDIFTGTATLGPAVMATIRFRPIGASCSLVDSMCLLSENPMNTRLVDAEGQAVPYEICCTDPILTNVNQPVLTCPGSVQTNADAGGVTAFVTWDPVSFSNGCAEPMELECTASNEHGAPVDNLIGSGGLMPAGLTEFECHATDGCGQTASCSWTVFVTSATTMEISVELSQPMASGPFDRCIEFVLFSNCIQPPIEMAETLEFGFPFNLPGRAKNLFIKIPAGKYACMTARDPLHTLKSFTTPQIIGSEYKAVFQGDPFFGGNWLRGGNLNGDPVIDIIDFGILDAEQGSQLDPNTPCGFVGPHADINGDGLIDLLDMDFIDRHMGQTDKGFCCLTGGTSSATAPTLEISLQQLEAVGLGHLSGADRNGDGLLNRDDLKTTRQGLRQPSKRRRNHR